MAKAAGQRQFGSTHLRRAHGLPPHRTRQFKLSNDPRFVGKLRESSDYVDPPAHAMVLLVDGEPDLRRLIAHSRDCR